MGTSSSWVSSITFTRHLPYSTLTGLIPVREHGSFVNIEKLSMFIRSRAFINGVLVSISMTMGGCAVTQDMSGSHYQRGEHRRIQYEKTGVVVDARHVTLNTEATYQARAAGAALGGAITSLAGRNMSSNVAQIALAILGAAGGERAANYIAKDSCDSVELVIRLDTGGNIVVVQETDPRYRIGRGDRVRIIEGQEVRVAPLALHR